MNIPEDILSLVITTIRSCGNKYFAADGRKYYTLKHGNGNTYEMDGDERPEGVRVWRNLEYIGTVKN